jgi:manganese transport system substrate-binding protein
VPNIGDGRAFPLVATSFCAAASLLAATACAGTSPSAADDGRLTVLTTFTVLADMTRAVAGDRAEVASVTRPGAEIHGYQPAPDDLVRAEGADLILENGLGLEAWFAQFTLRMDADTATLTDGIATLPIASGGHEGEANPHAWMSPDNALVYVDNIAAALTEADPAGADAYAANAEDYQAEIADIGAYLDTELGALPENRRALVTCESAFSYLARDAGLTERYLWPVNADAQGTPRQVADTVDFVRANDVPAVFCESTVNDGAMDQVARETGAVRGGDLFVDSLSTADGPVPTYLDLLRHDAETIVAGLTGKDRPA